MFCFTNCLVNLVRSQIPRNFNIARILSKTLYSTAPKSSIAPNPYSVGKLKKLFEIDECSASKIIFEHEKFANLSANEIEKNFQECINTGISREVLHKNAYILTEYDLKEKLVLLKTLPYDINTITPLLMTDLKLLKKFVIQEIEEKRIIKLKNIFKITVEKLCITLSKRPFLFTLDVDHIKKCCSLLQKYGISKNDILKDLWVLKYNAENIEYRLNIAKENNIEKLKTWMVRVPTTVLENFIRRSSDNKSILGQNSFIEYVCVQLNCSQELAKFIIFKHPAIQSKSLKKLNEMVKFLLSHGFTTTHICRTPKILLHSVDTIAERLKLIEGHDKILNSLSPLTKSKKQFTQFLETTYIKKDK